MKRARRRTKRRTTTAIVGRWLWAGGRNAAARTRTAWQGHTQVWCHHCWPTHYIRKADWPAHQAWAKAEARAATKRKPPPTRIRTKPAATPTPPPPSRRATPMTRPILASAAENIVEAFRAATMTTPPNLTVERIVAEQMAEAFAIVADLYRRLVDTRVEEGFPPAVLEPYVQIGRALSQCGDLHMEVFANCNRRYSALAEEFARRGVPKDYIRASGR